MGVGSDLALAIAALWQRDSRGTKPAETNHTFWDKNYKEIIEKAFYETA